MATAPEEQKIIDQANDLLENFGQAQAEMMQLQIDQDKEVKAVLAKRAERANELTALMENIKTSVAKLWEQHDDVLTEGKGKTATLHAGTVSERLSPASLEIGDNKKALKYLRRMRVLLRFTKVAERTIVKNKLKADRAFVNAAPDDIMWFEQKRGLYLKPITTQLEALRDLSPQRVKLPVKKEA